MIKNMFVVHDSKVGAFGLPFFQENENVAIRAFRYAANDASTEVGKYPTDFNLYHLGTYDDQTAKFVLNDAPVHVALAAALIGAQ